MVTKNAAFMRFHELGKKNLRQYNEKKNPYDVEKITIGKSEGYLSLPFSVDETEKTILKKIQQWTLIVIVNNPEFFYWFHENDLKLFRRPLVENGSK